jgi:dTMP kinase
LVEERSVKEGRKIDIHERDYEYLDRCYEAALYASDYLGWEKITCYKGDEIRSVEDIFAELLERLEL